MAGQHAKLSASGAHRWMNCPASANLEARMPDEGSIYAAEGTAAHVLAERCLRTGVDADRHFGETIDGFDVNDEMVGAVQTYLDYVRDLPGTRLIEQRVDFTPWVPGGFGTADAVVLNDNEAVIVDLKYGRGVRIEAEANPQAMLYALGGLHEFDFLFDCEMIRLVVVQPRLDHVSEHLISRDYLESWAKHFLKPAADLALSEDPPYQPGEVQCRFCKAKAVCRALAEYNLKTATEGFGAIGDSLELKDVNRLSNTEIATLLPQLDTLTNWAKAVEAYATTELEGGRDVPGYKLVEGRSVRKWLDEEKAGEALARKLTAKVAWRRLPITITQAEKLLGKGSTIVTKHTTKPPGRPTLAPLSDKRPALETDPTEGFREVV